MVLSLMLLNIAGGDCVEDLRTVEKDEGFCRILRQVEHQGMRRTERREVERRWRKERWRSVPSASAVFRYLSAFHDEAQEKRRIEGKAFVPIANEHLRGLGEGESGNGSLHAEARLSEDSDIGSGCNAGRDGQAGSLFSYKGLKSYQPLNTWWAEQQMVCAHGVSRRECSGGI